MRRALLALVLVAACSSGGDDPVAVTPIDFSAPTVGGGELNMAEYAGRDVAIWFWAPY